jgi:hypothetical protein
LSSFRKIDKSIIDWIKDRDDKPNYSFSYNGSDFVNILIKLL